jgi:hypothetical protein
MYQPILDYRADELLRSIIGNLEGMTEDQVFDIGELGFDVDTSEAYDGYVQFDKDDVIAMIEGRLLDIFVQHGLCKFSYVDYRWAKAQGIVP